MRLLLNMIPAKQRKLLMIAGAVLLLLAIGLGATGRTSSLKAFLIVGVLVIVALAGLWILIQVLTNGAKKKRQRAFDASLAAREGIDDRKREWQSWVGELERHKIDRYDLPFYLLVGEPQSGKSVLLQNSDLRFLFGQSRLSGIGGTRGCDWWFTDEAVILDLAGRLFTHDGGAADEAEWEAFLDLLNGFRPMDPANGIMLVIPCDSLLTDTLETSAHKASQIREALLTLTRKLEAKLPIYVVLTKGDKIFGFADTVHRLSLEQRHQMFGWSRSADELDHPVQPHELRDAWTEIVERGRQLRDSMLSTVRIPEAQGSVDRMLGFPNELEGLYDPLQAYFERIFHDSDLVDQLYFRGVYLTSGLQSGAAIAKVCLDILDRPGEADGRDLETLFVRQQAYFIKDLVRRRVFAEKGLVRPTSARVAKAQKTGRIGYGVAAAVALISVVWGITEIFGQGSKESRVLYETARAAGEAEVADDDRALRDTLASLSAIEAAYGAEVSALQSLHGSRRTGLRDLFDAIYDERFRFHLQTRAAQELYRVTQDYDRASSAEGARPANHDAFVAQARAADALRGGYADADGAVQIAEVLPDGPEEADVRSAHAFREAGGGGRIEFAPRVRASKNMSPQIAARLNDLWDETLAPSDPIAVDGGVGFVLGWYRLGRFRDGVAAQEGALQQGSVASGEVHDLCDRAGRTLASMQAFRAEKRDVQVDALRSFLDRDAGLPPLRRSLRGNDPAVTGSWGAYDEFTAWLRQSPALKLEDLAARPAATPIAWRDLAEATAFLDPGSRLASVLDPGWLGADGAADPEALLASARQAIAHMNAEADSEALVASVARLKLAASAVGFEQRYPTWDSVHLTLNPSRTANVPGGLGDHTRTQALLLALRSDVVVRAGSARPFQDLERHLRTQIDEGVGRMSVLLGGPQLDVEAVRVLKESHAALADAPAKVRASDALKGHLAAARDNLLKTAEKRHAAWALAPEAGLERESVVVGSALAGQVNAHLDALAALLPADDEVLFDPGRERWLRKVDQQIATCLDDYRGRVVAAYDARIRAPQLDFAASVGHLKELVGRQGQGTATVRRWHDGLPAALRVPPFGDEAIARRSADRPGSTRLQDAVAAYDDLMRPVPKDADLERIQRDLAAYATVAGDAKAGRRIARLFYDLRKRDAAPNGASEDPNAYDAIARIVDATLADAAMVELRRRYLASLEELIRENTAIVRVLWSSLDSCRGKESHKKRMRELFGFNGIYVDLLEEYAQFDDGGQTFRIDPYVASGNAGSGLGLERKAERLWVLDAFLEDMLLYVHGVRSLEDFGGERSPTIGPFTDFTLTITPDKDIDRNEFLATWDSFDSFYSAALTGGDKRPIRWVVWSRFETRPIERWGFNMNHALDLNFEYDHPARGEVPVPHQFVSCLTPYLFYWSDTKNWAKAGRTRGDTTAKFEFRLRTESEGAFTDMLDANGYPLVAPFEMTLDPPPPLRPRPDALPRELGIAE
ncbi:MAG: type VI secretion protein IcmF/TssM N-terminal domain-containing protein [Planctomycetota bacterium]